MKALILQPLRAPAVPRSSGHPRPRAALKPAARVALRVACAAAEQQEVAGSSGGAGPAVAVRFSCAAKVAFGEHLRVVGSAEGLGAWNVEAAPVMTWGEGDVWSVTVDLPAGTEAAFKFVHVMPRWNKSVWESTANRPLVVPASGQGVSAQFNNQMAEYEAVAIEVQDQAALDLIDDALAEAQEQAPRAADAAEQWLASNAATELPSSVTRQALSNLEHTIPMATSTLEPTEEARRQQQPAWRHSWRKAKRAAAPAPEAQAQQTVSDAAAHHNLSPEQRAFLERKRSVSPRPAAEEPSRNRSASPRPSFRASLIKPPPPLPSGSGNGSSSSNVAATWGLHVGLSAEQRAFLERKAAHKARSEKEGDDGSSGSGRGSPRRWR